jgi:G3E family GTPase
LGNTAAIALQGAVPALLVTGFLGSGKTRFVIGSVAPHLYGRRFAVLVNDFGELNFDGQMMRTAGLDVVEVEGGCICCTAGGQLLDSLHRIRTVLQPEWLVVEGSGLSDPYPLVEALTDSGFALEAVLCTVAIDASDQWSRHPIARSQLAAAHAVLLTRADAADDRAIAEATQRVREVTDAPVFLGYEGRTDDALWSVLSPQPMPKRLPAAARNGGPRITQRTVRLDGFVSKARIESVLARLPADILRVKGVLQCIDAPLPLALNWARGHADWQRGPEVESPYLVIIGEAGVDAAVSMLPACLPHTVPTLEDAEMMPLGDADARAGAAYVDGRPCSEVDAVEALAQRLAEGRWAAVGRPQTERPAWMPGDAAWCALDGYRAQDLHRAAAWLRATDRVAWLAWDLPGAVAQVLQRMVPALPLWHVGRHWRLPQAALSLCAPEPAQRAALELCLAPMATPVARDTRTATSRLRSPSPSTGQAVA